MHKFNCVYNGDIRAENEEKALLFDALLECFNTAVAQYAEEEALCYIDMHLLDQAVMDDEEEGYWEWEYFDKVFDEQEVKGFVDAHDAINALRVWMSENAIDIIIK